MIILEATKVNILMVIHVLMSHRVKCGHGIQSHGIKKNLLALSEANVHF